MRRHLLTGFLVGLATAIAALPASALDPDGESTTVSPAALPATAAEPALERLSGALRFATVSPADPADFDPAEFDAFRAWLRASYPRVFAALEWETVNTHSLLGHWAGAGGDGESAMFIAHYDVVPVAPSDRSKWSVAPFSGERRDGYVWGRGALDDKVNVIAILEALDRLLQDGWSPRQDLWFGFGHDEEIGGSAGAARIADALASRGVKLGWMVDEGGAVSPPGMLPGISRPVAMIGIAEKGYLSLELRVRAAGGHSSVPRGDSAIFGLTEALQTLQANPFARDFSYLGATAESLSAELGGLPGFVAQNLWFFGPLLSPWLDDLPELNAMVRTTVAPTMLAAGIKDNVQPTEARAVVNLRLLPGLTVEEARSRIVALLGPDVEVNVLTANEASTKAAAVQGQGWDALTAAIRSTAADQTFTVAPFLVMGGTDLKHYEGIAREQYRFAFLPLDRQDFRRIHGIDERVGEQAFLDDINFYATLIRTAGD